MFVSFIIPVYNAEPFLIATIESVLSCGYDEFECILIDDGSNDKSQEICMSYAERFPGYVSFYTHPGRINKGVSATRQLGIEQSKGELIYFLDADDRLLPGAINKYITVFEQTPEVTLIHGRITLGADQTPHTDLEAAFDLGPRDKVYRLSEEPYFLLNNYICNSTVCLRKSMLSKVDFHYDQAFQVEDWVLWTLLSRLGLFYYVATPVVHYRYHSGSATFHVGKKGYMFYNYTKVEFYMVLLARLPKGPVRDKVSNLLYEQFNSIYKAYAKNKTKTLSSRLFNWYFVKDLIKSISGFRRKS